MANGPQLTAVPFSEQRCVHTSCQDRLLCLTLIVSASAEKHFRCQNLQYIPILWEVLMTHEYPDLRMSFNYLTGQNRDNKRALRPTPYFDRAVLYRGCFNNSLTRATCNTTHIITKHIPHKSHEPFRSAVQQLMRGCLTSSVQTCGASTFCIFNYKTVMGVHKVTLHFAITCLQRCVFSMEFKWYSNRNSKSQRLSSVWIIFGPTMRGKRSRDTWAKNAFDTTISLRPVQQYLK